MVRLYLGLQVTAKTSSNVAVSFSVSMNDKCEFLLFHILTSYSQHLLSSVLDFSYSIKYVVISHCYFNFQFPDDIRCAHPQRGGDDIRADHWRAIFRMMPTTHPFFTSILVSYCYCNKLLQPLVTSNNANLLSYSSRHKFKIGVMSAK